MDIKVVGEAMEEEDVMVMATELEATRTEVVGMEEAVMDVVAKMELDFDIAVILWLWGRRTQRW